MRGAASPTRRARYRPRLIRGAEEAVSSGGGTAFRSAIDLPDCKVRTLETCRGSIRFRTGPQQGMVNKSRAIQRLTDSRPLLIFDKGVVMGVDEFFNLRRAEEERLRAARARTSAARRQHLELADAFSRRAKLAHD
jgi:hypothetical protein